MARNAQLELKRFIENDAVRNTLKVPNGTRTVFGEKAASVAGIKGLYTELTELLSAVDKEDRMILLESRPRRQKDYRWTEQRPAVVLANSY